MGDKEYLIELGNRIRSIREGKGMTQYTMGQHADSSAERIESIENGEIDVPFNELMKISVALETDVKDLVGE